MRDLDSQLGSFGLEPPKIYRRDQLTGDNLSQKAQRQPRARDKKQNATPQEKRTQQNKKRRLKKKVRRALYGILITLGIVIVLLVLSMTVLFKIETINITGNEKYTTEQVMAVLPIEKEKNLFIADTKGAGEKLEKNLPYIYDAEIKRKFPSTINVSITEAPKLYYIKNADKTYTILDDRFKVIEVKSGKKPKKSVEIKKVAVKSAVAGETVELNNEKMFKRLTKLSETVKQIDIDKVSALYSQDINNNFVVYDGRITIKLGSLDKAEDKLYSALAAIDKLSETNPQAEGEITATSDKQVYFTEK